MATLPTKVTLNKQQQNDLKKIKAIDKRGEFVARVYLQSKYGSNINFNCEKIAGADISANVNDIHTAFEVKATKDETIALSKLKVSSQDSYDLIVSGITVLRVMQADKTEPTISEIHHDTDFKLKAEERWRAENP